MTLLERWKRREKPNNGQRKGGRDKGTQWGGWENANHGAIKRRTEERGNNKLWCIIGARVRDYFLNQRAVNNLYIWTRFTYRWINYDAHAKHAQPYHLHSRIFPVICQTLFAGSHSYMSSSLPSFHRSGNTACSGNHLLFGRPTILLSRGKNENGQTLLMWPRGR